MPFIIDALRARAPVAWFEIGRQSRGDSVAQGNALARAVNAAQPAALLGRALPYRTQLNALRLYAASLVPLRLALTVDDPHEPLIQELLDLQHSGYPVIIDLRGAEPPASLLKRVRHVGVEQLRLSQPEATAMLPRALPMSLVESVWRESGGRFLDLLKAASEAAHLPPPTVPSPGGPQVLSEEAQLVEPALLVQALRSEGEYMDALEVAVMNAPELAESLLGRAGPMFQQEGLLTRLHTLLSALPEEHTRGERTLEWRMVAGFAAGEIHAVLPDVDAHLAVHAAPALRARRAGTLPREQGFELALEAVEGKRTALSLWQLGRLHPSHEVGAELLRESVRLAEEAANSYEIVRAAGALASRLNQAGEYAEAASWARFALDLFDRGEVNEGTRRLMIINDLGVARIMSGDLLGLRGMLEAAHEIAEGSLPMIAALLRSTLAWLYIAEGHLEESRELLEANYQASPRGGRARQGYQFVRVLLEMGDSRAAASVASDVTELAVAGSEYERALATLARGMVAAALGESGAHEMLHAALLSPHAIAEQRLMAAHWFLLVTSGGASRLPTDLVRSLTQLHPVGRRVLSGHANLFREVWATLEARTAPLTLRFLATNVVAAHEGREVSLPPRMAEVSLALALNPAGLTRDELNDFLGEPGERPFSKGGMRSMMTRLRSLLPVTDAPYRFAVPYDADVLTLRELLFNHRVREAVALYQQELLPLSEARGVVEERESLAEELRQAVLLSGDADALCELAERLGDDLEAWQAAVNVLKVSDPRLAVARARVRRLLAGYGLAH